MRQSLIVIILIFCFLNLFANKDRIERPVTYTFIFQNNDTVVLKNPKDSLLELYANDIVIHKKILVEVHLTFKTGESLTFKASGDYWETIKIRIANKEIKVPQKTLRKISEIHFESIAILWNGLYESAGAAGGFCIRFDIGTKKQFDKYPSLELFFTNTKFTEANIWKQTGERTMQAFKF